MALTLCYLFVFRPIFKFMTLFMFHYSGCSVYIIQEPCVAMGVQFGSLFIILEKR
uniref:Uncharacterized protein n=1 Tax=Oryza glumipatula TaxID=40148 RepID=A0A0D9YQJ1_9ORYZ